jgi:sigma-B regulation protein RsbU (phosphoserine phosphatase)
MFSRFEIDNLKESNEFLNIVLENINSVILLVDENMRILQFNKSFLRWFDRAVVHDMQSSFGQMAGCVNAVKENKSCGGTSGCSLCMLRKTLLSTLSETDSIDHHPLEHTFFIKGNPVLKHLEVSSRIIHFHGQKMILVIIYDVTEIVAQKRTLEMQRQQIDHELETAAVIQKSLLPADDLVIRNTGIAWRFEPSGHIGGDIFQIHEISPETIGIYMLDVCGHGVSAALIAVSVSQFLASLHSRMRMTGRTFSPEAIMKRLETAFPMERFDSFFSIAYAVLNVDTGRFTYCNAGHMPPLILRTTGHLDILRNHGMSIGTGFAGAFTQEENTLTPGDRLFLYTDGLVENYGMDGEREGANSLHACMKRFYHLPLDVLVNRIFEDADALRGGGVPSDDMSLISLEFFPQKRMNQ